MPRPSATTIFAVAQRAVPVGQRILPLVPEPVGRGALTGVLRRWPSLWGMFDDSKRLRAARHAYQLAFPGEDAEDFTTQWLASRGAGLAASLTHMARESAGRSSRMIDGGSEIHIADDGPCVIALLHYSIDPVLGLTLLAANPERDFRWPLYPPQPGVEDDRALWLAGRRIPEAIERALLPITASSWLVDAVRHVKDGGDLFIAMDAPFDRRRSPTTFLRIGQVALPLAASIELLARRTEAQLLFAWPEAQPGKTWILHLDGVADTHELAAAATRWIEENRCHWAGWPYLRWRENSVAMRRNVSRLTPPASAGANPPEPAVLDRRHARSAGWPVSDARS